MFDSTTSLSNRVADGVDLLIDFATLGEYGLEPTGPDPRTRQSCQGDRRTIPTQRKLRERGPQTAARKPFQRPERTQSTHRSRTKPTPTRPKKPTNTRTIKPMTGSSDLWAQMTTRHRPNRLP